MTIYDIERKLNDKVDRYELHNIQNENRELKNQIRELERQIGHLEGVNSNRYYLLDGLLNLLTEHPQFADISDNLIQLRNNL